MQSIILYCTCPDTETAEKLSHALVDQQFAACVNIFNPVTSVYRWQGKVEQDSECLLMIKSTNDHYNNIEKVVMDLHPYELPELIAVPVSQGLPAYLDWIEQCTQ